MTQYCRYCAYCFEADDYRCSNHPKGKEPHWTETDIKRVNKCKNFALSDLGDIITGRPYRPRKKIERGTLAKYLDPPSKFDSFQEDLFSMLMGNKYPTKKPPEEQLRSNGGERKDDVSVPMLEFKVDNEGYIFLQEQKGDRVYTLYLLVDVPNCAQYGKVKLGDVAEVAKESNE